MFIDSASKIKVGYGLDESIQMGPMQNKDRKERTLGFIKKGVEEGAKLILDGRKVNIVGNWPQTCFINPTIFTGVTSDMTIAKEEIFGPVAAIMRARSLDDAIEIIHSILLATLHLYIQEPVNGCENSNIE